jgi:hypothetical protein
VGLAIFTYVLVRRDFSQLLLGCLSVSIVTKQYTTQLRAEQPGYTVSVPYKGRYLSLLCSVKTTSGPYSLYCPPGIKGRAAVDREGVENTWSFISTVLYVFMA